MRSGSQEKNQEFSYLNINLIVSFWPVTWPSLIVFHFCAHFEFPGQVGRVGILLGKVSCTEASLETAYWVSVTRSVLCEFFWTFTKGLGRGGQELRTKPKVSVREKGHIWASANHHSQWKHRPARSTVPPSFLLPCLITCKPWTAGHRTPVKESQA